ncbi:hypothetical protein MLD38_040343 [Melastoma candidum]|uniref:Uncharacterized protein n=1 Tax=Melastoma candidum TaxID=119954 RepID=A0ACB9L5Q8_9MYRT|nr:hypothetical protein MLD38_040343 [Melastoma candidum]
MVICDQMRPDCPLLNEKGGVCYECNKPGHMRPDCPLLNEKGKPSKYKKDVMMASWSDSDEESDQNDEIANICDMAQTDAETEKVNAFSPSDLSAEDIENLFSELYDKIESLTANNKALKKENKFLSAENDSLKEELSAKSMKAGCFKSIAKDHIWYLDSGCSRHMSGDVSLFSTLVFQDGGAVTFGDNGKGMVKGTGTICCSNSLTIEGVLYVKGFQHNLISISQLCDKGYHISFDERTCNVSRDGVTCFIGERKKNIYVLSFKNVFAGENCLLSVKDEATLWHRRLGHANYDLLSKLARKDAIKGLPKIKFDNDKFYPSKALLELLHMDFFGPTRTQSLGGKRY